MKNSYLTVTDQFCGAGGSSQGIRNHSNAIGGGIEVKLALNHWKLAIETHNTNFPDTLHDCTDISACDPRRYPKTNILITSPECTNHSLAKGKKRTHKTDLFTSLDPEEERSRATMWDVPRFAEYHDYEIIIVENVVDARYWVMWDAWLLAMHRLGYAHKCVYLNSMFCHPTPQSRDRMYIVFWKKGNKAPNLEYNPLAWCHKCEKDVESIQVWRNSAKQWGKYRQQYDYRCTCGEIVEPYYYAAFNCIDWSIPGTRIGDRKKPLSDNTIKRIQYGIEKYWNEPQIITTRYTSGLDCRVKGAAGSPLPTHPGDQSHAILNPIIVKRNHNTSPGSLVKDSVNDPLPTQLTDNGFHVLSPILSSTGYTPFITSKEYDVKKQRVKDAMNEPGFTQTTHANVGVVMPFIVEMNRTGKAREANEALRTILAGGNHHGIVTPFVVECHGQSKTRPITERLGCLTTKDKYGLITHESFRSFIAQYYGGSNVVSDIKEPVRTISTHDRSALVTPGQRPQLEDCYYRMLLPHEVQLGMAFDADYIVLGNGKQKVKQLGNAVTPPAMQFLSGRCIETLM